MFINEDQAAFGFDLDYGSAQRRPKPSHFTCESVGVVGKQANAVTTNYRTFGFRHDQPP
jgi:hypothetical protein